MGHIERMSEEMPKLIVEGKEADLRSDGLMILKVT